MLRFGKLLEVAARVFCAGTGLRGASRWSAAVADEVNRVGAEVTAGEHRFHFVSGAPLLLWRAQTFSSKEPETLSWIRGFAPDEVLFDIGANVGLYSVYAAGCGARVYAFEPEASNFAILNRNIQLNAMTGRIQAYCLAVAEESRLDTLRLASLQAGAALHSFGRDVDFKGDPFRPAALQGCMSVTLDDLVFRHGLPCPTRIKVDVDGLEREVVAGARRVLADPRTKGLLIEVNENDARDSALLESLGSAGYRRSGEGEAIVAGQARMRNVILERAI